MAEPQKRKDKVAVQAQKAEILRLPLRLIKRKSFSVKEIYPGWNSAMKITKTANFAKTEEILTRFAEGPDKNCEFYENCENCKICRDVIEIMKITKTAKFCKCRRKPY